MDQPIPRELSRVGAMPMGPGIRHVANIPSAGIMRVVLRMLIAEKRQAQPGLTPFETGDSVTVSIQQHGCMN